MTDDNTERFEFESENAPEIARTTLNSVDMSDVVRIAVEIERKPDLSALPTIGSDDDGGEDADPEVAADGAEAAESSAERSESEPDTDIAEEEEARQMLESTIGRVYPIVELLDEEGPKLTLEIDQELGYNAAASLTWLAKAGMIERDTVSDGESSWMYINRLTERGRVWLGSHDEPETTYPTETSSPPRESDNLERYKAQVTGDEFDD